MNPHVSPATVLLDANVLYSKVLRDLILYPANARVISVAWSPEILEEACKHLEANITSFDPYARVRLMNALTFAFPYASLQPSHESMQIVTAMELPDPKDHHVLASALTAEADILCTSNLRHFPVSIMSRLGIGLYSPDQLLCELIDQFPEAMRSSHELALANLAGATYESTFSALVRAGAPKAAERMRTLLATTDNK